MPIPIACSCGYKRTVPDHLAGEEARCSQCGTTLVIPSGVRCLHCGAPMAKAAKKGDGCTMKFFAMILGLILTFGLFWTIIAPIFGIPLILASPFLGPRAKNVWRCGGCGYFFERA